MIPTKQLLHLFLPQQQLVLLKFIALLVLEREVLDVTLVEVFGCLGWLVFRGEFFALEFRPGEVAEPGMGFDLHGAVEAETVGGFALDKSIYEIGGV